MKTKTFLHYIKKNINYKDLNNNNLETNDTINILYFIKFINT
jgi:hypothetical protein